MAHIDLNLLNALDVLLAEGSVTGAAERLHLSVPATSRTLDRIRKAMGDPILVRAGRGLAPTPRALAIQSRLHELLAEARELMRAGGDPDLAALERTFTLRANDVFISVLPAALLERTRSVAPGIRLRFMAEGEEDLAPLRDGRVDLDLGAIGYQGPEIRSRLLFQEQMVGMMASGHPLADLEMSPKRLASAPHVVVSRRGHSRGALDTALERHGLERTVAAVVPSYTGAAHIVLTSDLIGLFPERYARQVAAISGARIFPVDLDLPLIPVSLAWHVRHDSDPVHQWLRQQIPPAMGVRG